MGHGTETQDNGMGFVWGLSPNDVTIMMILATAMVFFLPVLVTLYLYMSGVYTNRRSFQSVFYALLAFFALTIGISMSIQYSHQNYDPPATTPISLSKVLSKTL
jgi:hypothetical protein